MHTVHAREDGTGQEEYRILLNLSTGCRMLGMRVLLCMCTTVHSNILLQGLADLNSKDRIRIFKIGSSLYAHCAHQRGW
jgi:hypothetical protein